MNDDHGSNASSDTVTEATSLPASTVPPRPLRTAKWIWLVGTALSVVSAVIGVALFPGVVTGIWLGLTTVQAAVAVPAALMLTRGKNWARLTLFVLACFSVGSLYQCLKLGAWPSLVLNLALACTLGMVSTSEAKAYCRRRRDLTEGSGPSEIS